MITDKDYPKLNAIATALVAKQGDTSKELYVAELEGEIRWRSACLTLISNNKLRCVTDAPYTYRSLSDDIVTIIAYSLAIAELLNTDLDNGIANIERSLDIKNYKERPRLMRI